MASSKKKSEILTLRKTNTGGRSKSMSHTKGTVDPSYVPKQKTITAGRNRKTNQPAINGVIKPRHSQRKTKKTEKALEAERAFIDSQGLASEDPEAGFLPHVRPASKSHILKLKIGEPTGPPAPPTFNLKARPFAHDSAQQNGDYSSIEQVTFPAATVPASEMIESSEDFLVRLSPDIYKLFDIFTQTPEVQLELPELSHPDPQSPDDEVKDISQPYKSKHLFHLYILAYHNRSWNICDLVVDTWIREFQRMDESQHVKFWKKNKSRYQAPGPIPPNDNGSPDLDCQVGSFDFHRLSELYTHTAKGCGARFVWADSMALGGGWLECRLDWHGMARERWPPELIWDVMRTSLRLARVRRTLKVEEKHPSAWYKRYHEHAKHGQPCYREVAREKKELQREMDRATAERERARIARLSTETLNGNSVVENGSGVGQDGGANVDGGRENGAKGKHVHFRDAVMIEEHLFSEEE